MLFCKRIGVPRTTFKDHINNSELSFKSGPSPILSVTEENALVALLRVFVTRGIPIGANQMINYGTKLIRKKSGDEADHLGKGWWERFRGRHPEIKTKHPSKVDPKRMDVSNSTIQSYFDLLR